MKLSTLLKSNLGMNYDKAVHLEPHNPLWAQAYAEIQDGFAGLFKGLNYHIAHVGSTALPIMAKPILDIALTPELSLADVPFRQRLVNTDLNIENGNAFIVIKDDQDRNLCHIHTSYKGNTEKLLFKKFLLEHPNALSAYESLKKENAELHPKIHNYSRNKTEFVTGIVAQAERLYDKNELISF
ncbi:MAG: GrpB family protein [Christensenellaceae bacterium]|jgi:GrpB-like predicted nucleotidyltransferase (UPF0157 family)|nr:GrpB family protein [Christensenellaceae bacterium]